MMRYFSIQNILSGLKKQTPDSTIRINTTAKLSNGKKHNPIVARLNETKLDTVVLKSNLTEKSEGVCISIDARAINFSDRIKRMLLERISNGEVLNFIDANIVFGPDDVVKDKVLKINDYYNPNSNYVVERHILGSA